MLILIDKLWKPNVLFAQLSNHTIHLIEIPIWKDNVPNVDPVTFAPDECAETAKALSLDDIPNCCVHISSPSEYTCELWHGYLTVDTPVHHPSTFCQLMWQEPMGQDVEDIRDKITSARFVVEKSILLINLADTKTGILLGISGLVIALLFQFEKE